MERFFAEHLEQNLCECLIPVKEGSRFLEVMDGIDLATYSYIPYNEEDQQVGPSERLFPLEKFNAYKNGTEKTVQAYAFNFYNEVMGIDLERPRRIGERQIYRPTPVLWQDIASIEMLPTNAPGEEDIVLREHNDRAFVIPTDITDADYYRNSLKSQLRMSLVIRNLTFQEKMCGYFKLPSDSPRNPNVPDDVDMRSQTHNWSWLQNMTCSLDEFAKSLSADLKDTCFGDLKRQKLAIANFQKKMKLGDASFYTDRGEASTYIGFLHEYIQLLNLLVCQSLRALDYMLDEYATQNEDLYKLLEQHVNRFENLILTLKNYYLLYNIIFV